MTVVPTTEVGPREGEGLVAVLEFLDGELAGREVVVAGEGTIGRAPDCTVVLTDTRVSARHASILIARTGFRLLEDGQSAGGTFVNDVKLKPGARAALRTADVIQFGRSGPRARFRLRSHHHRSRAPTHDYAIVLTVARGVAEQARHELVNRPLVTIGRDPECDVVFRSDADAKMVSKRHARIVFKARDFVLEDLGSANGTLVDGEVVDSCTLREGDIIEVGAGGPVLVVERLDVPSTAERALVAEVHRDSRRWRVFAVVAVVVALVAAAIAWAVVGWPGEEAPDVPVATPSSDVEVFQALRRKHQPAVLFVWSRFEVRVPGREDPVFEGDSFGSGFVVLADGHAITSRHVVEPWRGDPAYALGVARARREHGEVEVVQELAVWPEGTVALTEAHGLELTTGYNTDVLKNLRVIGFPPLHTRTVEVEGEPVELVANDHTDLALLQLVGLLIDPAAIPPLASPDHDLEPLDPVVSFGYPRGDEMLEGTLAEMSATRGEVSKIEETIQLHAPVYPGNSGGPVLDREGKVVGITTRRWGEATSVCIPARMARALLAEHVAGVVGR